MDNKKTVTLWVNSEVEQMWNDFTIEKGSIKRNINLILVNEPYYSNLVLDDGGFVLGDESTKTLGTIEAFQRYKNQGDDSTGHILLFQNGDVRGELGMNQVCYDTAMSMLSLSIRVQKHLEENGVLDKNPENDKDNLNIYVGVEDNKIVSRILENTSDIKLTYFDE